MTASKSQHALDAQHNQPASEAELSELLRDAAQSTTSLVFGNQRVPTQADGATVKRIDLSNLNTVLEHEIPDQVISIETGIKIADLNSMLAKHKQMLPARVPDDWTLLDVIARGDTGSLEHGYGSARELVLGCQLVQADGGVIKCGGKVVKNVTGYDMTKLIVGSHCWLGVPVSAHLRLYALPDKSATLAWSFDSLVRLVNCANSLLLAGLPFAAMDVVQNDGSKFGAGRFVLLTQTWTQQAVLEEILTEAERIAGRPDARLSDEEESALWRALTDEFMSGDPLKVLHVVAPPTSLSDIVSALPGGSRFVARPSRGKITVLGPRPEEAVEGLTALSRSLKQPFTVAFANTRYNHFVKELPAPDPVKHQLKLRLKQKFDPQNILNPFVQL